MAQIRPMQISPVDYGQSNALRAAAGQQISGGLNTLGNLVTGLRNEATQRNTANVLGLINGATSQSDLAARQQQASQLMQQYGGDVDTAAIQKAQAAMPDTLLSRASNQASLTNQQNALQDQQYSGQAAALLARGDYAGASQYIQQMHNPTQLVGALLDAKHADASEALQRQQLAQSGANAAASRGLAQQEFAFQKQKYDNQQNLLKQYLAGAQPGGAGVGGIPNSPLAQKNTADGIKNVVTQANNNLTQDDVATGGKNNLTDLASKDNSWWSSRGDTVLAQMKNLKGVEGLSPAQQANLYKLGQAAYTGNSIFSSTSGEQAATQAMQSALDQHLANTQTSDNAGIMQNTYEAQLAQQQKIQNLLRGGFPSIY